MEEFERAPQIPPKPESTNPQENATEPNAEQISIPFQSENAQQIHAREILAPLRTLGAPASPQCTPPQAARRTPDSPQTGDEAQPNYTFEQSPQPSTPPATVSLPPRPPEPVLPKPRAIFITSTLLAITLIVWFAGSREGWFGSPDAQEVARAQLLDLDQGHWRAAYDLFSPRYRGEVSFETWRDMALMHSLMFHTREMRFEGDQEWNGGAALEVHLLASSGDRYLARFKLIYTGGHWWVDDLHWGREQAPRGQVTI